MQCQKQEREEGSVVIVALCFVAVLGIALASYLAVSNQAMRLSNRSYQKTVSEQLGEMGLEEALRAFNANNWSNWSSGTSPSVTSATWYLDAVERRAYCTIALPPSTFGQGLTGSIKVRMDNYDAAQLGSNWSPSKTYGANELVGANGVWYRSVQNNNVGHTPGNLAWWVEAPIPWKWDGSTTYSEYDIVNFGGFWYLYKNASPSSNHQPSPSSSYWTLIPAPSLAWDSSVFYPQDSFVYSGGTWYRCIPSAGTNQPVTDTASWDTGPPYISWNYRASAQYSFNDVVYYNGVWYRYISTTPTSGNDPTTTAYWNRALSGIFEWSLGGINYYLNDVVYWSGDAKWHRCVHAHVSSSSITPANTLYWTTAPLRSSRWDPETQYAINDAVSYNGTWYLSLSGTNNYGRNPMASASPYWIGTDTPDPTKKWNAGISYAAGDYRCYGNVWYRCLLANINKSPNNAAYWAAVGTPVVYAEASVAVLGGRPIRTVLRATIAPVPLFPNAIAASTTLAIGGGTGRVDSYDSMLSGFSYSSQKDFASLNTNYSAVIAAGGTGSLPLTIGNGTTIKGYLAWTSPPAGIGSNVTVQGAVLSASNVNPERISRSPYIPKLDPLPLPNLTAAFTSGNLFKGAQIPEPTTSDLTINLGTPGAPTASRYFYDGDFKLRAGSSTNFKAVNIRGPVILQINGALHIETDALIDLKKTGTAEIHYTTSLHVDSDSHGILNRTNDAKKLILISDSSSFNSTYINPGSSASEKDFYGVIFAPNTTATAGVDIKTGLNMWGAISARKVTFSNEANLHYDTSLRTATFSGIDAPYIITEWRELTDPTEQVIFP